MIPFCEGGVAACMATYPGRFGNLKQVVASLVPQIDQLYIYVNETLDGLPDLSRWPNVTIVDARAHEGDLSATGKLFPLEFISRSFVFLVDDDFIYPPDYVARYRAIFAAFDDRCCVTTHGGVLPPRPLWYFDRCRSFDAQKALDRLHLASLAGSGTFAFHQDRFTVRFADAPREPMVDLFLSMGAFDQGLPIWCAPRPERWLRHLGGAGLWEGYRARLTHHTNAARSRDWSFDRYREIADRAVATFDARAAEGFAAGLTIDSELRRALEVGGEPSSWRRDRSAYRQRKRYFDLLLKEEGAA